MAVNAVVVLASAALTTLLPRRSPARVPAPRGGRRGVQRRGVPLTTPFTAASACAPADGVKGPLPPIGGGRGTLTPDAWVRRLSQEGVMTTLRAEFSAAFLKTS
jgi:hypothetical protein